MAAKALATECSHVRGSKNGSSPTVFNRHPKACDINVIRMNFRRRKTLNLIDLSASHPSNANQFWRGVPIQGVTLAAENWSRLRVNR